MMTQLTSIVSTSKSELCKHEKIKKLSLNSQLDTYQILTNNKQMMILYLTYFITIVKSQK